MDKRKSYILTLALLLMVSTVALSALRETRLDAYISIFAIDYFVASAIFRPRRRTIDFVGIALFIAFTYIVALKVMEILIK
jgi:hypothetical protein